ncbi:MAG: DUF4238 domain-containing protein [Deltaproteobacteria bacterium]
MTNDIKRKHHFVPAFYLRGFTDPSSDNMIWVYNKGSNNPFCEKPENIGLEKHYHTFENLDGSKDTNTIEDYFCHVWEGPTKTIIDQIKAGKFPVGDDRKFFASFLGLSFTRSPNHRANVDYATAQMLKSFSQFSATNQEYFVQSLKDYEYKMGEKLTDDPEELRQYILEGRYDVKVTPELYLKMFISHGIQLGLVIAKMKWAFIRATDRFSFLTSDNPFFFHDPSPSSSSFWRGVGLLNENVEVTFPISKELALIATWKDSMTEMYIQGSHELARTINRCSVAAAHRAVYASEKSDALLRLVRKFANDRPTVAVG